MDPGQQAERDVESAMRKAFVRGVLSVLRREPNELLPFDAVRRLRPHAEHYRGVRAIPVDQIIGSVDRYREFDQTFLPKTDHLVDRWVNIRRLRIEGRELPPVQVYQVGDTYFVKDGNHRVSVAHSEGQHFIDAEIIELDVTVPPEAGDGLRDLILKGEYAAFLDLTRLGQARPGHAPILFTTLGRYEILIDHIRTRQYYLGLKFQREVTWEESVGSWYDRLYGRMIEEVHGSGALAKFPGRTEADLYLWMMDHRYFLTRQYGHDPGSRAAVTDFTRHHRTAWWRRLFLRLLSRVTRAGARTRARASRP